VFLYRVARARQLLRQLLGESRHPGSWVANRADAVNLVMEACNLARYDSADDFDVFEALVEGRASAKEIARAVAGNICGVADPQLKNILAKPIRIRSAK
jgi:hypothetical protein